MADLTGYLANPSSVQDEQLELLSSAVSCFSGKGAFVLVHHVSSYLIYHLLLVPSLFNLFLLRQVIYHI